jgi:hypothetical protein
VISGYPKIFKDKAALSERLAGDVGCYARHNEAFGMVSFIVYALLLSIGGMSYFLISLYDNYVALVTKQDTFYYDLPLVGVLVFLWILGIVELASGILSSRNRARRFLLGLAILFTLGGAFSVRNELILLGDKFF